MRSMAPITGCRNEDARYDNVCCDCNGCGKDGVRRIPTLQEMEDAFLETFRPDVATISDRKTPGLPFPRQGPYKHSYYCMCGGSMHTFYRRFTRQRDWDQFAEDVAMSHNGPGCEPTDQRTCAGIKRKRDREAGRGVA